MKRINKKIRDCNKKNILSFIFLVLIFTLWSFTDIDQSNWSTSTSVSTVLKSFGDEGRDHDIAVIDKSMVQMGEDLIKKGRTIKDGKKSKLISKFFKCTDCHNIVREDPDLRFSDPETRLDYAIKKDIPFLQGTTLYGIVNRETWYNGDYVKKYGELVVPARNSLRESIQLCSDVCSQGRRIEKWEEEAILSYLWTIDLKLEDLNLSEIDLSKITTAKREKDEAMVALVKSNYLTYSPATFIDPVNTFDGGDNLIGDPKLGEKIYTLSCLNCHGADRPAKYLKLSKDKLSYKFLRRKTKKGKDFSIYNITRDGTHPIGGHRAYMPHYTKERLSNKQLEDLRAFIYQGSK